MKAKMCLLILTPLLISCAGTSIVKSRTVPSNMYWLGPAKQWICPGNPNFILEWGRSSENEEQKPNFTLIKGDTVVHWSDWHKNQGEQIVIFTSSKVLAKFEFESGQANFYARQVDYGLREPTPVISCAIIAVFWKKVMAGDL